MNALMPRSLVGQTILVLLVGLTVSHLLAMWLYANDRVEMLAQFSGRNVALRVAEITKLFEETPDHWHERLIRATDSPTLSVSLTPEGRTVPARQETWLEAMIRGMLSAALDGRQTIVRVRDHSGSNVVGGNAWRMRQQMHELLHLWPPAQVLSVSVPLGGGRWLNFESAVQGSQSLWSARSLLSLALMTAGVLLVSFWVVRRITRPLATFATAAERLGKDVQAPPLPLEGPIEVRRAAQAFNQMQARIRRLIENRTLMLAAISHDLRTPITLLRLRAEFVENEEERRKMLATLESMEQLIATSMSFAREDATREENSTVDLAALLASVCDDLADAGAAIELDAPDRLSYRGRAVALKRAFINLVENAVKYGDRARVTMTATTDQVEIVIDDDGPGIPEEQLREVFTPFYRVEKSRSRNTGGMGLGLAVALAAIQGHGGDIRLVNRQPHGLRAVITLPR